MKCIYKITNPIGQIYIGQTKDFDHRMDNYKRKECKRQQLLYMSIVRYGWESHISEIIESNIPLEEIDEKETYYIDFYKAYHKENKDIGLNLLKYGRSTKEGNTHNEKWFKAMLKPILQYDLKGRFLKEWASTDEACKTCGLRSTGISACLRGKSFNCGIYIWKYKIDDNYSLKIKVTIGKHFKTKKKNRKSHNVVGTKIKVYDLSNKKILYFDKQTDCAEYYNMCNKYLNKLLRNNKKYNKLNLYFKYCY